MFLKSLYNLLEKMNMNFEESTINTIHQQSGFDQLYIEKVLRLLGILELFFSHPVLKDKYALKGGTALNLFYFNLPRLSVDIDLNYIGLDREIMLIDRQEHENILRNVSPRNMQGENGVWAIKASQEFLKILNLISIICTG